MGVGWLQPQARFGLAGVDPLTHSVLWSLGANCLCYVLGSLFSSATAIERRQAAAFVEAGPYPILGAGSLRV